MCGSRLCADLKAKQGQGFEVDFSKVQAHLGPGKVRLMQLLTCYAGSLTTPPLQITHSDFSRDLDLINKVYTPTALQSFQYLRAGSWALMLTFFVLILVRFLLFAIIYKRCFGYIYLQKCTPLCILMCVPQIGIVGDFSARGIVVGLCFGAFGVGTILIIYSKWIEQGGGVASQCENASPSVSITCLMLQASETVRLRSVS